MGVLIGIYPNYNFLFFFFSFSAAAAVCGAGQFLCVFFFIQYHETMP